MGKVIAITRGKYIMKLHSHAEVLHRSPVGHSSPPWAGR